MIRALLFDFDGLILETEGPVYTSWLEIYRRYGAEIPYSRWVEFIGTADPYDLFDDLQKQCKQVLDRKQLQVERFQRELELILQMEPLPGVMKYLKDARRLGLQCGIASSSSYEWVSSHLERLGLTSYFKAVRTSDDVLRTKPDPALYLSLMEALQIRAEEGLAFEDSPNGVLAAKRAGLYCIAVPNEMTSRLSFELADLRLTSLADLPLSRLLSKFSSPL